MITMIIVEDESFERKSLIHYIDWNLIGVKVVGEAANGEQGLALVKEHNPDIVLTDINMPIMNAIEMTTKIRQFDCEVTIIFLSSYDDFEYAKQAIELHIFSYIMKPINEGELLKTVKRAVDSITEKRLEHKINDNYKNTYINGMSLLKEALLLRALMGMQVNKEEMDKAGLNWLFYKDNSVMVMFLVMLLQNNTEHGGCDTELVAEQLKRISTNSICACFNKTNMISVIRVRKERMEEELAQAENILYAYFNKQGFREVKIVNESNEEGSKCISEMYENIFQNNMLPMNEMNSYQKNKKMKSKQEIVGEIDSIIMTCYAQQLTIESIARKLHFTPNYIGMIYKNSKQETINHFLMRVRLQEAKKMLIETDFVVNEISYQCGFDNVTYFHTIFKKNEGITPNEYRKRGKL